MDDRDTSLPESTTTPAESPIRNPIRRRDFVRTGGAMLAVSVLGTACDEDSIATVLDGRLRLVISGLGANLANGGEVRLIGTGIEATVPVPATGIIEQVLPVGVYRVVYTAPQGYVLASGQASGRDVAVEPGVVTEVLYVVISTSGRVRVSVSGLGAGVGSGGNASLVRTDVSGQAPIGLTISASGSSEVDVASGTYEVTYSAPAGYGIAPGQPSTRSVVVGIGQTATASFSVVAIPVGGVLRISVSGYGAGAATAGSVLVQRLDQGGQLPISQTIPASGTVDITLTAGTYAVSFTPPSGHDVLPGVDNPQIAEISTGQTRTVSFAVVASGPAIGTIRVTINGLTSAATAGGTVHVARVDGQDQSTVNVPLTGVITMNVTAGNSYRVTYAAPSGFVVNAGQENPQTVQVLANQTHNVTFAVSVGGSSQPTTGTARIAVTGLTAGATSGGSATLTRTDVSQPPINVNIPATGSFDVNVQVGSYSVSYAPPAGHQMAAGVTNPQSMNILAQQITTVTFGVAATQGGGSTAGLLFFSDWRTATGTSNEAKSDGGKWNIIGDPGGGLDVVAGGPLGFPTTNVLRVTARESAGGYARLFKTGLGVPAAGQSRFYRWYFRNMIPLTGDNSTHPVESGQLAPGLDWTFNVQVLSNTTWRPEFRPGGDQTNATLARWTGPVLTTGTVYRFELQIQKINNSDFIAHIRVYNAANSLIADDDDFNNYDGGLVPTTRMTLANLPTLHFRTVGGTNLDEFRAGINSLVAGSFGSILYAYQGGFAVRGDDWAGPYNGSY